MSENDTDTDTNAYESFLELVKKRHSCRRFRADPLPEGHLEKLLEAARWSMSGANAQPWEFIVVRSPDTIARLYQAYQDYMNELNFWLEQRFPFELRHPGFRIEGDIEAQLESLSARPGWSQAPALIVVLGDGRRQLASVSGASTPGRHQTHLTDALSIAETHIHLAAASLGLSTQWVSIHVPDPFKRILKVPAVLTLHTIIPVGYPELPLTGSVRRKLTEMVHDETYDQSKFMSTRDIVEYLYRLRASTVRVYRRSRAETSEGKKGDA